MAGGYVAGQGRGSPIAGSATLEKVVDRRFKPAVDADEVAHAEAPVVSPPSSFDNPAFSAALRAEIAAVLRERAAEAEPAAEVARRPHRPARPRAPRIAG